MKSELNILMLEDDANDAELVQNELRQGGLQFRADCVQTQQAFVDKLEHDAPDVILSDHGLPAFSGFDALALAKQRYPGIPFIFVTGREGHQNEIETLQRGATDYILKTRLSRLVPAVKRAIREGGERTSRDQDFAPYEIARRFPPLTEAVPHYSICMLDEAGRLISWSVGAEQMAGYQSDEILGQHFSRFYPLESIAVGQPALSLVWAVTLGRFEEATLLLRKDRFPYWAHVIIMPLWDANEHLLGFTFIACEVPAKRAEDPL